MDEEPTVLLQLLIGECRLLKVAFPFLWRQGCLAGSVAALSYARAERAFLCSGHTRAVSAGNKTALRQFLYLPTPNPSTMTPSLGLLNYE